MLGSEARDLNRQFEEKFANDRDPAHRLWCWRPESRELDDYAKRRQARARVAKARHAPAVEAHRRLAEIAARREDDELRNPLAVPAARSDSLSGLLEGAETALIRGTYSGLASAIVAEVIDAHVPATGDGDPRLPALLDTAIRLAGPEGLAVAWDGLLWLRASRTRAAAPLSVCADALARSNRGHRAPPKSAAVRGRTAPGKHWLAGTTRER